MFVSAHISLAKGSNRPYLITSTYGERQPYHFPEMVSQ